MDDIFWPMKCFYTGYEIEGMDSPQTTITVKTITPSEKMFEDMSARAERCENFVLLPEDEFKKLTERLKYLEKK